MLTDNLPNLDYGNEEESEETLNGKLDKYFQECDSYRRKFEPDWREYERFYHGIHWRNMAVDDLPYLNLIFKIIEAETPILTDSRPGTDVLAINEERQEDARVLKEAIDYVYHYNNIDLKTPQSVRTSLRTGTGFFYVDWDPEAEHGQGQVIIKNVNWPYVWFHPGNGDLDHMACIYIKMPEQIAALKKMFPDYADAIEAEDIEPTDSYLSDIYRIEDRDTGRRSPSYGSSEYKPVDMAYIHECFYKDYTMERISEDQTAQDAQREIEGITSGMAPDVVKYMDHASIIQILMMKKDELQANAMAQMQYMQLDNRQQNDAQQQAAMDQGLPPDSLPPPAQDDMQQFDQEVAVQMQLLMDAIEQHQTMMEQNPNGEQPKYPNNIRLTMRVGNNICYDGPPPVEDGYYPIVPLYCYKDEALPYGISEVKNILQPQKMLNELLYAEHMGLRLCTNPGWVMDAVSGVDKNSLTNEPGLVVVKKQGTEVTRLPPGEVSPQLNQAIQQRRYDIDDVSGVNDAAQGKKPSGVTAASAISLIQDQSIARIRLKTRGIENFTFVRLGQLVASRVIKYWKTPRMLKVYDGNGQIRSTMFDPSRMQDLEYQVRVSPGSTVGMSKEYLMQSTKELLQAGVITPKMFVTINDIPYKNMILAELEQRDQLTQQAQALAAENEQLKAQLGQSAGGEQAQPSQGQASNSPMPQGIPAQ